MRSITALTVAIAVGGFVPTPVTEAAPDRPTVKAMRLDAAGEHHLALLQGPPETVTMRSGLVLLAPGTSVGRHNTDGYEEMIVVLEGQGEMRVPGATVTRLERRMALYCPPGTEHDVLNTGTTSLLYVYVVSKATQ